MSTSVVRQKAGWGVVSGIAVARAIDAVKWCFAIVIVIKSDDVFEFSDRGDVFLFQGNGAVAEKFLGICIGECLCEVVD